ncbi:MAG: CARDB domain-containing protein, partial [archaeon]
DIEVDDEVEYDLSWIPTEVGEYYVVIAANTTDDANWKTNTWTDYVSVLPDAPDVRPDMYYYGDQAIVNKPIDMQVTLQNEGFKKAYNVTGAIVLMSGVYYIGLEQNESIELEYGARYNITLLSLNQTQATFKLNDINHAMSEGDVMFLSDDVALAFISLSSHYADFALGNSTLSNLTFPDIDELGQYETIWSWTPSKAEAYRLFLNISVSGDYRPEDNRISMYVSVREDGPDVSGRFRNLAIRQHYDAGETITLPVTVSNEGSQKSRRTVAELYTQRVVFVEENRAPMRPPEKYSANQAAETEPPAEEPEEPEEAPPEEEPEEEAVPLRVIYLEEDGNTDFLVDRVNLGKIDPHEDLLLDFNWTPGPGIYYAKLFTNASVDVYDRNNYDEAGTFGVVSSGTNVEVLIEIDGHLELGELQEVVAIVANYGTESTDTNVTISVNNEILQTRTIENLDSLEAYEVKFNWTPEVDGNVVVTLRADAANDSNPLNNVKHETVFITNEMLSVFNVTGTNGSNVLRLIGINGGEYWLSGPTEITAPTRADVVIADPNEDQTRVVGILYQNSEFDPEMTAMSDSIRSLNYKHMILANKVSWNYNENHYLVGFENVSDIINSTPWIYACKIWNFEEARCESGWTNIPGIINIQNNILEAYADYENVQAFAIGEPDLDLDDLPDSIDIDDDGDGINDSADNCNLTANKGQTDVDEDGLGDICDPDMDGDGIPDFRDPVIGRPNQIRSNVGLNMTIDNSTNLTGDIESRRKVEFKNEQRTFVAFNYDFSMGEIYLPNVSVEIQPSGSTAGYAIVKGLDVASQGLTKNITIDNLAADVNTICIKDAEIASITEISANCDGSNESLITCDGTLQNGYTCALTGAQYLATGLKNSGVIEKSADTAPPPGNDGPGGGNNRNTPSGPGGSCMPQWECSGWSGCFPGGTQERTCRDSRCGALPRTEGQDCTYHCSDGLLDSDETGIDCGGSCGACAVVRSCPSECTYGCSLDTGVCIIPLDSPLFTEPTCDDKIRNQNESGVDCGGPCRACSQVTGHAVFDSATPSRIAGAAVSLAIVILGSAFYFGYIRRGRNTPAYTKY